MCTCPLCTKTFQNSKGVKQHVIIHTKEKPYKCLKCPAVFSGTAALKRHIKRDHDGIKEMKEKKSHCPNCSYKCISKQDLQIHLRKHSTELPFSCEVPSCGFKTIYERSLSLHVRAVHRNERPFGCPTEGCNYKATSRQCLKSHLKYRHSDERPVACSVPGCNYTCKIKSTLAGHVSRAHSDEKPFKCSICDFRGKLKIDLRQHQRRHMRHKRFQCQAPNCSYSSHFKASVEGHFDAKHRKHDMRCTEPSCRYKCSSILLRQRHVKRHSNPMLKCPSESCNLNTRYKDCLQGHLSRRHKDLQSVSIVGQGIFKKEIAVAAGAMEMLHCPFPNCGYQTEFQHHYDRHRVTHNKEEKRKHVCSFCFSRFSRLCHLNVHLQRHIREKPVRCSHCKFFTVTGSELGRHTIRDHCIRVTTRGQETRYDRKCITCGRQCLSYAEFVLHTMTHLQPIVVLERLRVNII